MSQSGQRLRYDPHTGPERQAWLGAPEAERTRAVRRWLKSNEMPFPCCLPRSADEWREVEDQLASRVPQATQLLERMLRSGVERIVAVWAMAEAMASLRYRPMESEAGREDADDPDIGRLFEQCDVDILPAAFEASVGGFGPAHEQVIDYYHQHFDPDGAMPFAVAAGFCFGCAASPKFIRNQTLYEHMYGNEIADATPVYLPIADAYRELFRYVSDAVFEQDDPIPPSVRPPPDPAATFDSAFSDWCKGFAATRPVVSPGWDSHLTGHPDLHAEYVQIVDNLRFFASRSEAQDVLGSDRANSDDAIERMHAGLSDAIQRLFLLAHPVMEDARTKR